VSELPRPDPAAEGGPEQPGAPDPAAGTPGADAPAPDRRPRPVVERVGMAAIALVMAVLFALVGAAAFIGGEPFLGVMGVCGCLMVLWVGGISALRG
jgi:hypothetical protein